MTVDELTERDGDEAVALWEAVGLTRPWNDPVADFRRCDEGSSSAILGVRDGDRLVGTVMVGDDGHRGWVYYVAVATDRRREGIGSALLAAAEEWLRARGAVKLQLMVRDDNVAARAFYEERGFVVNDVTVFSRWLTSPSP